MRGALNRTNGYVALVAVLAICMVVAATVGLGDDDPVRLSTLAMVVVAWAGAQFLSVPIPHRRGMELGRLEEALVVPAVVVASLGEIVAGVMLTIAGVGIARRHPPVKVLFNAAQMTISVGLAALIVGLVSAGAEPLTARWSVAVVIGLLGMFCVNQSLVCGVLSLHGAGTWAQLMRRDLGLRTILSAANACLGFVLAVVTVYQPLLLVTMLPPLLLVYAAGRAYVDRSREDDRLRWLNELQHELVGEAAIELVAGSLLQAAAVNVHARCAELRIERYPQVIRWTDQGDRPAQLTTVPAEAPPLVDEGYALFAPLHGRSGFRGTLLLGRRSTANLSSREETVLDMLLCQAQVSIDALILGQRLAAERTKVQQIFDHSGEGIALLDSNGVVLAWNAALAAMTSIATSDAVGRDIRDLLPEFDGLDSNCQSGKADVTMGSNVRSQLRVSFSACSAETVDEGCWVLVVSDVTREREVERLKDEFLSSVSHQFRTPLTTLIGFLETLSRPELQIDAASVPWMVEHMLEQARRLERLVSELLDVTSMRAGREPAMEVLPVDAGYETRLAVRAFRAAHPDASLCDIDTPSAWARADRTRLQEVVTHLLENAHKHAGPAACITVTVAEHGDEVWVRVHDDGHGIPARELERIWEPFHYGSHSVGRHGEGVGLGLYLCRKLVDGMGASIDVSSMPNDGTTFTIRLPRAGTVSGNAHDAPAQEALAGAGTAR